MPDEHEWDIPKLTEIIDYTTGTTDPLTMLHTEEFEGLQAKYDENQYSIEKTRKQYQAESKTLSSNIENLAQLKGPASNLIENNLNLVIIAIIFYYLFKR